MSQQLRAHATLAEDLDLIPRTHIVAPSLVWVGTVCMWCDYIHEGSTACMWSTYIHEGKALMHIT